MGPFVWRRSKHPLSGCAASPSLSRFAREGDDTLAAGRRGRHRPLLGVPRFGPCRVLRYARCHTVVSAGVSAGALALISRPLRQSGEKPCWEFFPRSSKNLALGSVLGARTAGVAFAG